MKFRTAWDRGETTFSPEGSPIAYEYGYRIDKKTGKRIWEKTGETNIYEKIQSNLEGTLLENIIKRCTDPATLMAEGKFIDLTEVPSNLMEMQNTILRMKEEFNQLDAETRKKFENSSEKYVSLYGSEEWANNLGFLKKAKETPKEEPKTEGVITDEERL